MKVFIPRRQATLPIPKTGCPNCGKPSAGAVRKQTNKKTKK